MALWGAGSSGPGRKCFERRDAPTGGASYAARESGPMIGVLCAIVRSTRVGGASCATWKWVIASDASCVAGRQVVLHGREISGVPAVYHHQRRWWRRRYDPTGPRVLASSRGSVRAPRMGLSI